VGWRKKFRMMHNEEIHDVQHNIIYPFLRCMKLGYGAKGTLAEIADMSI
jgi:hypothetical protein